MLASAIAPRWMMVNTKARALVDALDRGETITIPHPTAALPTDAAFAICVLAETVGGAYELSDCAAIDLDDHG